MTRHASTHRSQLVLSRITSFPRHAQVRATGRGTYPKGHAGDNMEREHSDDGMAAQGLSVKVLVEFQRVTISNAA